MKTGINKILLFYNLFCTQKQTDAIASYVRSRYCNGFHGNGVLGSDALLHCTTPYHVIAPRGTVASQVEHALWPPTLRGSGSPYRNSFSH